MQALNVKFNGTEEVICLMDKSGTVLHASLSVVSVSGYRPEEIVGRNAFDLIHRSDRSRLRRAAVMVLARGYARRLEVRARHKQGTWLRMETMICRLPSEYRPGTIVVSCREPVARNNASEPVDGEFGELLSSHARLEHFAWSVAHDLREPLRTISIYSELLIKDAALDAHGKLLAKRIAHGVTRLSELFEGLHSFAISGSDRSSESVHLAVVVSEVLQDLKHAITLGNATVTVGSLPFVRGNKVDLARIFQNLIVNAIKYRREAPVEIHVTAEQLGPKWIVKIEDNGIGIPPAHQEKVFDLFKRLHGPEIPGAGIGLAICRKIVEAMGDEIWVESTPGGGSTFCFTIAAIGHGAGIGGQFGPDRAVIASKARA